MSASGRLLPVATGGFGSTVAGHEKPEPAKSGHSIPAEQNQCVVSVSRFLPFVTDNFGSEAASHGSQGYALASSL